MSLTHCAAIKLCTASETMDWLISFIQKQKKKMIMSRKICFKSLGVIGIKGKYNLCLLKFRKSKQALCTNSLIKANVVNVKYFLMICKCIFLNLCFYHILLSFETQKKNRFPCSHIPFCLSVFFYFLIV